MVTEIKLLPCPFCGGEVKIDMLDSENSRNVKIYSAVHCPKCHEWFFKGLSKEKTIAAWNRRADAVPVVRGEWEEMRNPYGGLEGWIHKKCGRTTKEASNFCPNCGAKMEARNEER
jgi:Lar family restriction alleviation protein